MKYEQFKKLITESSFAEINVYTILDTSMDFLRMGHNEEDKETASPETFFIETKNMQVEFQRYDIDQAKVDKETGEISIEGLTYGGDNVYVKIKFYNKVNAITRKKDNGN